MKFSLRQAQSVVKKLSFRDGLVTAVARDFRSKDVLMVAHMNEEAVIRTLTTGLMHYWSRSRGRLWLKGEVSRHYQHVRDVWVDCNGDALVFDVEQVGAACHKGYYSCFYRKVERGELVQVLKRKFKPEEVY
ncbi:MAG: phosphoribosyl-AMP cyclohydrolase [Candidatus Hodarchaeaceae archaeon]|nr:phosphoribosyl-AMP cyclohydrolase [Candidatus Hodarchaeaceae archaeon]